MSCNHEFFVDDCVRHCRKCGHVDDDEYSQRFITGDLVVVEDFADGVFVVCSTHGNTAILKCGDEIGHRRAVFSRLRHAKPHECFSVGEMVYVEPWEGYIGINYWLQEMDFLTNEAHQILEMNENWVCVADFGLPYRQLRALNGLEVKVADEPKFKAGQWVTVKGDTDFEEGKPYQIKEVFEESEEMHLLYDQEGLCKGDYEVAFFKNCTVCEVPTIKNDDIAESYEKAREADRVFSVECKHNHDSSCPICDMLHGKDKDYWQIAGVYGPNDHEECAEARNLSTCHDCKRPLPANLVSLISSGSAECPHCKHSSGTHCKHKTCRGLLVKDYNPNTGKWFTRCQDCGGEQ